MGLAEDVRLLPHRTMRSLLISLSQLRSLARLAVRSPLTRPVVARFEFQMLYGVRRDLQRKLLARGYTVRIYVPFGQEWYPYFMRRLAERPANVGFMLRAVLKEEARRVRGR